MNASSPRYGAVLTCVAITAVLAVAAPAQAQPTFSKVFIPDTIGPGSVSTLRFEINNSGLPAASDLAFTDTLPAGVSLAEPAFVSNTCSGTVTAVDGGTTITLVAGMVGAGGTCEILVNVTAPAVDGSDTTYPNTSGDLTSSAGNSGPATDDLMIDVDLPGFSKSFAPSSVPLGGRSTLTLTIDNTANGSGVTNLDFTDNLPVGMVIADPANASTTCGTAVLPPILTAVPGTSLIVLDSDGTSGFPAVAAGATCTVTVEVVTSGVGLLGNTSGELLADFVTCGKASAALDVTVTTISLIKSFTDDPVPPGGTVILDFRIDNFDRNFSATGVAFADDLSAALTGLTFDSLLANDCSGSVLGVGTTTITFSGGTLAVGGSCTISTSLSVPAGATPGIYTNTTGAVSATIGGSPVTGNMASDDLFVEPAPVLAKLFVGDPINAGDDVVIRFTIVNVSTTSGATDIEFIDELTTFLPFPVTVILPPTPNPPCGAGSSLALISLGTDREGLELTGGTLASAPGAGASCTFDVTLTTPAGLAPGVYLNITEQISATVDGATRTGDPASDTLAVIGAPSLSKAFIDDPVAPGGTVTLEFSLTYAPDATGDATGITFTDNLAPVLAGLTATLPPTPDPPCGVGSSLTGSAGDTLLTLTGGTLTPGSNCTFGVTLNVPAGAAPGSYANTTSVVTATVQGLSATSAPADDDLRVTGLAFTKEFTDDPVIAGATVTLEFTIENISPADDATGITFTDNLSAVLSGLQSTSGTLTDVCGSGSQIAGTSLLIFTGGNLMAADPPCTFSVTLDVPSGAADGVYSNITSGLSATLGGSAVTIDPATDDLTVNGNLLQLTKEFNDDPVAPGDTATLEFTLTNLDLSLSASGIGFTDDLGTALSGLTFSSLLTNDCGGTVAGVGTTNITFSGGGLAAGGQCTISVAAQVPGAAAAGSYTNTTSQVTGDIGGLPITGDPATDDLSVGSFTFSKVFGGPVPAGGTTTLEFTIENLDASSGAVGIAFSDDLDAVVPGMVATGLPASDVCGPGSLLSGTSFLTLTGGNLGPGGSCVFSVDVQIPLSTTPGIYDNTTSALSQGGIPSAEPATAPVDVQAAAASSGIPVTTPIGMMVLIALIAGAALWRLRWRV